MWSKKLLRCMKAFYNYLLNKHLAAEKSASYYVSWVTKAYAFFIMTS